MTNSQIIITDAGPLIALAKTGYLSILKKLFKKVLLPPAVYSELNLGSFKKGNTELTKAIFETKWLEVTKPLKTAETLKTALDIGEAEAITLAKHKNLVLLIDERKGRKIAQKLGVKIIGTGPILIAAKKKKIISQVASCLDSLQSCGYHISKSLRQKILALANEK